MGFSFGVSYQEALSYQDGAGITSLWCLWSQWKEESGKHSSLSQLCLWIRPGRELVRGHAAPGAWWASQKNWRSLADSAGFYLHAVPFENVEGWESWSTPHSAAPSHSPPETPSKGRIQRDGNHGTGVTAARIPAAMSAAGADVTLLIESAGSRRSSWPEVAEPWKTLLSISWICMHESGI